MREEGIVGEAVRVTYAADMRYLGQAYELEVPILAPLTAERVCAAQAAFHLAHERVYGYARGGQPVEFVNFRAIHTGPLPRPSLGARVAVHGSLARARLGERRAHFAAVGFVPTPIFDRARLPVDARLEGPAIVEQADTTTVIPPGYAAIVERTGNLRIRRWT
jgi:N-methylhydantoinase A